MVKRNGVRQNRLAPWLGVATVFYIFAIGATLRFLSHALSPASLNRVSHQEGNGFRFADVSDLMNLHFVHQDPDDFDPLIKPFTRLVHPGTGVGVADVNGDGWMDILLLSSKKGEKNRLFINQGGTGFKDEAEVWGIADTNGSGANISPVFFDYDNDGKPDLFISRMGCSLLFHNTGSKFENVTKKSGLGDCMNSVSAIPFDYDQDGRLDLYVVRYWPSKDYFNLNGDPEIFTENFTNSMNGGSNTLYHNQGNGTFLDVTEKMGGRDNHWSYDAVAGDLNNSGKTQLYVANDFGPDSLFLIGKDNVSDITQGMGVPDRRSGMDASLADLDGSGSPFVWVSNIWRTGYEQEGNLLLKFDQNYARSDHARDYNVETCGWAWGAGFADFDLDGRVDFYVANGYISGGKEIEVPENSRDYTFKAATQMATPGISHASVKNWQPLKGASYAGHEVGCLFMNRGNSFENASAWASPNQSWDGRAVGLIDYDNNGSVDLIVTTQDGPAHLLKNEVTTGKRWIGFKLVGVASNRDAVGAKIRIKQNKWLGYRWATGGKTGFMAFSDPRLHFGLPKEDPVQIQIWWPSGKVQQFEEIPPGKYYQIQEGNPSITPFEIRHK